ncbi:hypothetical protein K4F52_008770 [Lecanicillium sp. MT-2017a]|nr:hypothetical protein K4F52_008770 [Lecanicillium sp. MT-2017a]
MGPKNDQVPVVVLDSDEDVSDAEFNVPAEEGKKRKAESSFSTKVEWTDESDHVPAKPKRRRAKRKSAGKKKTNSAFNDDEVPVADDWEETTVPDYVIQRRQEFDAKRRDLHEAALCLPPDYTDIDLGEANGLENLEERPDFSNSGIRPVRPYEDIELPQSAGLLPASIAQYLRDYQVDGAKFLHRKFVYQEGGILGDDMGLGKTVQVIAFLTAAFGKTGDERDDKRLRQIRFSSERWYPRILIICPGSLLMNWKKELDRWGWWHADIYHGANKEDVLGTARAGLSEIMITTYDTYKNARSAINIVKWDAVVADECHKLKDRYSETTKAMNELNALCRIGLTGTAIQNKYEELWTLLDWTNPGQFGTKAEWTQTISKPLAVGQSHEATMAQLSLARQTAQKLVQNLLPRCFLRRMKTLIADQLPKKTDRVVFCPLTELQGEAYENFLSSGDMQVIHAISETCEHGNKKGWCCGKFLPNNKPWQSIIFPSMICLQKLSNHLTLLVPSTTDLDEKHESELNTLKTCMPDTWATLYQKRDQIRTLVNPEFCGKWKVLKKLLKFWHGNGDKVLVFSHSVRLLRILQHLFTNTSYNVSYLDGSLSYEQRQDVVDTFNSDPSQFVFLISTKAGGVGLNITSANKVVIIDPHWNPAYDLQAQDRAYRIGQTRDVEVFRLISLGTVEEVVYARQIYKQQQANIGYTASSERRYFRGVQQDADRKGEIFGLSNIFTYRSDSGLLRDIVNKTNIAEAKAGVSLADLDMERAANDDESLGIVKQEEADAEDGGVSQLAKLLTAEDQKKVLENRKAAVPKSDAIQAILTSAGVEYTHDNAEVVGSSKIEEQLSKRAAMASNSADSAEWERALFFTASQHTARNATTLHGTYNPPEEVRLRHFCEMAKEFGFVNAKEFAMIVESWSQEARRNCLDAFYKRRVDKIALAESMQEGAIEKKEEAEDEDVKLEPALPTVEDDGGLKREDITMETLTKAEQDVKDEVKPKVEAEEAKVKMEIKGEMKSEDEGKVDIKTEAKNEVKDEDVKKNDIVHDRMANIKVEDGKKRTSIFLLSDDEDDEL